MKRTKEELLEFYGLKPGDVILVKRNGIGNWYKVSDPGYLIPLIEELGELKVRGTEPVNLSYISFFNWEYYRKEDLEKLGQKRCDATLCATCPLNILHHTFEYTKQEQPTLYEVLDKLVKKSNKVYDILKEQLDKFVEGRVNMITAKCIKNVDPWGDRQTDLEVGKEYEVKGISMGESYTSIVLKDKKGSYNSVIFEFYENGKPINIYKDRRFNPYL